MNNYCGESIESISNDDLKECLNDLIDAVKDVDNWIRNEYNISHNSDYPNLALKKLHKLIQ